MGKSCATSTKRSNGQCATTILVMHSLSLSAQGCPLLDKFHLVLAALLIYLAFKEAYLIPTEGKKKAVATTGVVVETAQPSGEVAGTWNLILTFPAGRCVALNMPASQPPVAGAAWPSPVWYDAANPADATARDPTVPRWQEVGNLLLVAAFLIFEAFYF